MKKNVCVLFGGVSPEHAISLRSAQFVLNNLDTEKYQVFPVGITREGKWYLYGSCDYSNLPGGGWESCSNNVPAAISPVRGEGLLVFAEGGVQRHKLDVVFPMLHGENGEDGAMQGLLQLAGIAYVGPHVSASAVSMDKTLTKLVVDQAGLPQAAWHLVRSAQLAENSAQILDALEQRFAYPMFVKPAGTGSSVGVSKAADRAALEKALHHAAKFDSKVLVEEFICGLVHLLFPWLIFLAISALNYPHAKLLFVVVYLAVCTPSAAMTKPTVFCIFYRCVQTERISSKFSRSSAYCEQILNGFLF